MQKPVCGCGCTVQSGKDKQEPKTNQQSDPKEKK